jgi:hypothetical protein
VCERERTWFGGVEAAQVALDVRLGVQSLHLNIYTYIYTCIYSGAYIYP